MYFPEVSDDQICHPNNRVAREQFLTWIVDCHDSAESRQVATAWSRTISRATFTALVRQAYHLWESGQSRPSGIALNLTFAEAVVVPTPWKVRA